MAELAVARYLPPGAVPVAFTVALVAGVLLWAGVAASAVGRSRFWPPGDNDRRLRAHWGLLVAFDAAALVVVVGTWDSWLLPRSAPVLAAGLVLAAGGAVLSFRAASLLAPAETAGRDGELRTDGLYARSRNPQYVGMVTSLCGVVLLANSLPATVLIAANVGWLVTRPLAEERRLAAVHGERFERYRERVPRFVGRRSLRSSDEVG